MTASGVRHVLVVSFCLGLIAYFAYHALNGRHGLEARAQLQEAKQRLTRELSVLEAKRDALRRDVALLGQRLDDDLLEERARSVLHFAYPNDLILIQRNALDPSVR